jgi:hypothetical protein
VFNSSGSGVHNDSSCTESTGTTGNNTDVTKNTINEACAGVLTGTGSSPFPTGNIVYNVGQTIAFSDSCPAGTGLTGKLRVGKLKPQPEGH